MSGIEAARGAFESWLRRENGKWADKITERYPDGRYCAMQAYMDWGAWQAAWAWRESELSALRAQCDELLELLKWADEKLGPEINPSNYDHQDVCELNANMVEVTLAIRAAIANAEKDKT